MIIAACVDARLGLQFNRRQQSKDAALREKLLSLAGTLRLSPAAAKQFTAGDPILVKEDYLSAAKSGDWCFCEDAAYLDYADRIEKIVLFQWNRQYPADVYFQFPGQWRLESAEDFPGTSHEKITMEVYVK